MIPSRGAIFSFGLEGMDIIIILIVELWDVIRVGRKVHLAISTIEGDVTFMLSAAYALDNLIICMCNMYKIKHAVHN